VLPNQRKLKYIFLSLSNTVAGMAASAIQYIGCPYKTSLMRVKKPPKDSHLLNQWSIIFSTFAMSQFQSVAL
jgi:hypothetical protein